MNIVAILLVLALCPIPVMGQGFSNFVGNAKRIFTTDMDVQETTAKPLPVVRKERWCGFAKQYKADGCDATVSFCLTRTSTATSTSCSRRITPRLADLVAEWLEKHNL